MFSIDLDCPQGDKDITIADLYEAGCTGIIELEEWDDIVRLRVFFDTGADEAALVARFGGTATPADCRDWVAFAREHLHPMEIGERIFVVPEWRDDPTPAGRIRIVTNAGLAFGTGAHQTTHLCLVAVERHVQAGMTIVDIGTGSGILSEAALKLGAARAFASDTDPQAIAAAGENFEKAGVHVPVFTGSADAVADGVADIITANISPAWIAELADDWHRILKPGGLAILSGFEGPDVEAVTRALRRAGLTVEAEYGELEWRMVEARRPR